MPFKCILSNKGSYREQHYLNKQVVLDFMAKYPPTEYKFMYSEECIKSPIEYLSRLEKDDGILSFFLHFWRTNEYLLDYVESIGGISKLNACGNNFKVIELSEQDSHSITKGRIDWEIECNRSGEYFLLIPPREEVVIRDLCDLIHAKLSAEDIQKYIKDNKIDKFTQNVIFEKDYDVPAIKYCY